ncbi:MAG: hypothetical protein V4543_02995 [Bacteroidota bacterium]
MVEAVRNKYNAEFTEENYKAYQQDMFDRYNYKIEFRIAETPVFVPKELKRKMIQAGEDIIDVLVRPDYKELTKDAVPKHLVVPGEDAHTTFLAIDFAICEDAQGQLEPQLIELQGFPSLFCFQDMIALAALKYFNIPNNYNYLFNGLTGAEYRQLLKEIMLNGHKPENVILLEVEPEKQSTKVDFYCTEEYTGVRPVDLAAVIKEGRKLFYMRDGVKTPIERIYNRVIFDELEKRTDLKLQYTLTDDVDVEWAGHPNWFFRISKYTLPFIDSPFVPKTSFLSDLKEWPTDLENYVLKPLFSFAGKGVIYDVQLSDLEAITDPHNYILMKKIYYAPALKAPDGEGIKTEIRMLYLWKEEWARPKLCTTLVRMSKSVMMGVKFNKDKTWVGGSVAFFEND